MEHQKLLVFNPRVVKYFLEGRVLKGKFDPHTCIVPKLFELRTSLSCKKNLRNFYIKCNKKKKKERKGADRYIFP